LLLQDALDRYVQELVSRDAKNREHTGECMEMLADYLLHYSDLFQDDPNEMDEMPLADWEQELHAHMSEMMDGDVEPVVDLYGLELDRLEAEHLRDFLGWYLLRELGGEAVVLSDCFSALRGWLEFLAKKGWIGTERRVEFLCILDEMQAECERAGKAAQLLFHFVRMGSGISPRLRSQRFSRFVEGHARIARLEQNRMYLSFDSQEAHIGPVPVAGEIAGLLRPGDVLDVELGLRAGVWMIVDVGPVYPASVYVEAEEFEPMHKVS